MRRRRELLTIGALPAFETIALSLAPVLAPETAPLAMAVSSALASSPASSSTGAIPRPPMVSPAVAGVAFVAAVAGTIWWMRRRKARR